MTDTETPVTASTTLSPRLARLVGSNPDADQVQVLLRPSLGSVPVGIPEVKERFSESDKRYAPRTDDADVRPEEPRLSQTKAIVNKEPTPLKTASDAPHARNNIPEGETQVDVTPPNTERDFSLLDETSEVPISPHPGMLGPPPVITRILAEKTTNLSKIQTELTPAPTTSEPLQVAHERTGKPPELLPVPAIERKVERHNKTAPPENMPRHDKESSIPDKAQEERPDIPSIRPETVEVATELAQQEHVEDSPHVRDKNIIETPAKTTEHPAPRLVPRLVPAMAKERLPSPSPKPLTAKIPEPKLPIRVEIGALNITLRQPDPPRARPALSVSRKAPRAHTIPLRGFGED